MSSRRLALVLAGLLFSAALAAQPQDRDAPCRAIPRIRVSDLPHEARETLALIRAGGPFPMSGMAACSASGKEGCCQPRAAPAASTPS
jgi:guanyl-specific ribonuclease Sa